jgi:hypothetical protein
MMGNKPAKFGPAAKKAVRKMSREPIEAFFLTQKKPMRGNRWIRQTNRYRVDCIGTYFADCRASTVDDGHLIEYVSASAPTHIVDGWSFFSRAVDAAVRGDAYSAIHFGYYAELRAAMGLLASEGVGIFNNKHPIIPKRGAIHNIPEIKIWRGSTSTYTQGLGATHAIIWPCLNLWAEKKSAAQLFDHIIQPGGVPLSRWLAECGVASPSSTIADKCLRQWGVDLAATNEDHSNRNLVSYRPSDFRPAGHLNPAEVLAFVEDLWLLFEPSPQRSRFQTLEQHLLRQVFRISGKIPAQADIERVGLQADEAANWARFFASPETLAPLADCQKTGDVEDPRCHLQVLSRAALLLFLASASTRRHLAAGQFDPEELAFWWHQFGIQRGIWPPGGEPDDSLDVWGEVSATLDEVRTWRSNQPQDFPLHAANNDIPASMHRLSGFEIGSMWSLLP